MRGATELRRQVRSQVQLGNEGKGMHRRKGLRRLPSECDGYLGDL